MNIASFIISAISFIFTGATILWAYLDRSNRILKYRICRFIYNYYSPSYLVNNLPSSSEIFKKFNKRNHENKNARLQYLLIELSHEKMIEMVTNLYSSFEDAKWKPNVNVHRPKSDR